MSTSINIFVDSTATPADFAQEMSTLLGVELQPSPQDDQVYEFYNSIVTLTVDQHRLPDFGAYRYRLAVRSDRLGTDTQRKKWREDWAYDFYHALKTAQKYRLKQATLD